MSMWSGRCNLASHRIQSGILASPGIQVLKSSRLGFTTSTTAIARSHAHRYSRRRNQQRGSVVESLGVIRTAQSMIPPQSSAVAKASMCTCPPCAARILVAALAGTRPPPSATTVAVSSVVASMNHPRCLWSAAWMWPAPQKAILGGSVQQQQAQPPQR